MAYKLVKEESKQKSRSTLKLYRAIGFIVGVSGISSICVAAFVLVDIEHKAHEPVVDPAYSSTPAIIISLVLIAVGVVLLGLAYYFSQKGSRSKNFLRGTDQYWVKAFTGSGGAAPQDDELPYKAGEPDDTFQYSLEKAGVGEPEAEFGVAFCPHCKKVVEIESGSCLECGNPVITD